jgi:hypothetical protein
MAKTNFGDENEWGPGVKNPIWFTACLLGDERSG